MYAEEYLADDANDYDFSDISIEESSSIDTETRDRRKVKEAYKRLDKDYYTYKRKVFDGESIKLERVELYSSPLLRNSKIRNAITGIRMEHRVGSKYEDLYFKIMDVSGSERSHLNEIHHKLYYDNPEQCERHLQIVISKDDKEKWLQKNLLARSRFCR